MSFLSFRHLNCLAILLILSFTSLVPLTDIAFVIFSLPYLYLLSSLSFPTNSTNPQPIFPRNSPILTYYISVGAVLGLVLPIVYILHGILANDKPGIQAAVPHLFLLCAQIFLEGLTFSGKFTLPVRAFVPIFYNSKRLFTIYDWVVHQIYCEVEGELRWRLVVGRAIAAANLVFWSFNLFGFLLPVYLPRALKSYYRAGSDASVQSSGTEVKD